MIYFKIIVLLVFASISGCTNGFFGEKSSRVVSYQKNMEESALVFDGSKLKYRKLFCDDLKEVERNIVKGNMLQGSDHTSSFKSSYGAEGENLLYVKASCKINDLVEETFINEQLLLNCAKVSGLMSTKAYFSDIEKILQIKNIDYCVVNKLEREMQIYERFTFAK